MHNSKRISGPINIIQLKGDVDTIPKTITIFMDMELGMLTRSPCPNSINIKDFLKDVFQKHKGPKLDFFLETQPTSMTKQITFDPYTLYSGYKFSNDTTKYINQVIELYSHKKKYPNVRFHYLDISDYLYMQEVFEIGQKVNTFIKYLYPKKISDHQINQIKDAITMMSAKIQFLYASFFGNVSISFNYSAPHISRTVRQIARHNHYMYDNKIQKLLNKIIYRYKHLSVKAVTDVLIGQDLLQSFQKLFSELEYLNKIVQEMVNFKQQNIMINVKAFVKEFGYHLEKTLESYHIVVSKITDIYFIRRFLDKDYIKNGIVYAGVSHCLFYIFVLVKYFGFEIVNASYLNESLDTAHKIIKRTTRMNYILKAKDLQLTGLHRLFIPESAFGCPQLTYANL